jgi:hypothetical protein
MGLPEVIGAKDVGTTLTEVIDDTLFWALDHAGALDVGASVDDVRAAAAATDEATAAAPQLAGSMPSGQHTPSLKQKEPFGHDHDLEQHFWPASGL